MSGGFPTCQDISVTIPAGGEEVRAVNGEMLAIIAATTQFLIAFDSGSWQVGQAGLAYQGRPDAAGARPRFAALRFRNPTANPITIDVQVSNGDIFDNRAIFGAGNVPVTIVDIDLPREALPTSIPHLDHISCAPLASTFVGVSAPRRSIILRHLGSELMWIKSVPSTGQTGIPLVPGERLEITTSVDLYIRNTAAFAQSVSRAEMVW